MCDCLFYFVSNARILSTVNDLINFFCVRLKQISVTLKAKSVVLFFLIFPTSKYLELVVSSLPPPSTLTCGAYYNRNKKILNWKWNMGCCIRGPPSFHVGLFRIKNTIS